MKEKSSWPAIPDTNEVASLTVAAVAVIIMGVISYRNSQAIAARDHELQTARSVMLATGNLLTLLKDAETGQRGYLLTGADAYLAPYHEAVGEVPKALDALIAATGATPGQATRVEALRPLVNGKMAELAETVRLKAAHRDADALEIVRTDRGKAYMDQLRALCAEIQANADRRVEEQTRLAANAQRDAGTVDAIGSVLLFVLLAFATITIRRGTRRRMDLIDALKTSERQTTEARDWLETTLASIGDGVIATDAQGNVVLLNPVAQQLTGWSPGDALGKPLEQVFVVHNEETGEMVESPVAKVMREGRVVGLANHTRLTSRDGRKFSIADSAAPIRQPDGRVSGIVMVFRDVTAERETERETDRTQRALAWANKDLERFAFAASHDLREPLRSVKTFSQMLARRAPELSAEDRQYLDFIITGVSRMEQLVERLLEFSVAGGPPGPHLSANLEDVLSSTLDNLKTAIDEEGAVVTHDPLPAIPCDPVRIGQVFQNLIGNAIKYRSEQPPRIHVSARLHRGDWIFSVADNGPGIKPEYFSSIFEMFKRLHTQERAGSGIGLATCRQIVERAGGRIWVESEIAKGSTFFFSLPAAGDIGESQSA